jgi:hypothetical protein
MRQHVQQRSHHYTQFCAAHCCCALQNSNLVLQADRGKRRGEDGAGEVESLWGKTKGMKMGDRIATTRPPELEAKLQKAKVHSAHISCHSTCTTLAADIVLH